jgi:hypothetical protein
MALSRLTGIYNFTNPGAVTHPQVKMSWLQIQRGFGLGFGCVWRCTDGCCGALRVTLVQLLQLYKDIVDSSVTWQVGCV